MQVHVGQVGAALGLCNFPHIACRNNLCKACERRGINARVSDSLTGQDGFMQILDKCALAHSRVEGTRYVSCTMCCLECLIFCLGTASARNFASGEATCVPKLPTGGALQCRHLARTQITRPTRPHCHKHCLCAQEVLCICVISLQTPKCLVYSFRTDLMQLLR